MLLPILAALLAVGGQTGTDSKSLSVFAGEVRAAGEVQQLIVAFTKAQHDFDQARLRALTTEGYVEISPIGDVDPRDKMLGFYDPAKRVEAPALTLGEAAVRMVGRDTAVAVTMISYAVPTKDGPPRTVAVRAVFVAARKGGVWKLASAQYTPIRANG